MSQRATETSPKDGRKDPQPKHVVTATETGQKKTASVPASPVSAHREFPIDVKEWEGKKKEKLNALEESDRNALKQLEKELLQEKCAASKSAGNWSISSFSLKSDGRGGFKPTIEIIKKCNCMNDHPAEQIVGRSGASLASLAGSILENWDREKNEPVPVTGLRERRKKEKVVKEEDLGDSD